MLLNHASKRLVYYDPNVDSSEQPSQSQFRSFQEEMYQNVKFYLPSYYNHHRSQELQNQMHWQQL